MSKKTFDNPTLLLVEHGSTEFSAPGDEDRIHGTKYDLPLTREGHNQAAQVAETLGDYDIHSLHTSPMQRARETAEHISDATGVKARQDEGLRPLDSGYLSGMTHEAAHDRIEYYVKNAHKTIPEGESYGEWWDKASGRMAKRLAETKRVPEGKANVDVLHSSEIASMPGIIRGEGPCCFPEKQIPGAGKISAVTYSGGKWRFTSDWTG